MSLRLRDVQLSFSFWFFAVVLVFTLTDRALLLLYLALPIAIHELGHFLALRACRVPVTGLSFTPFSLDLKTAPRLLLPSGQELLINLAGILANLIAAGFLYLFCFQSMRTMLLVASNIAVALFNLLPVQGLDGGEVLRLFCERRFTPRSAQILSNTVSFLVLTPLFAISIFLFLRGGNFSLMLVCLYLAAMLIFR